MNNVPTEVNNEEGEKESVPTIFEEGKSTLGNFGNTYYRENLTPNIDTRGLNQGASRRNRNKSGTVET